MMKNKRIVKAIRKQWDTEGIPSGSVIRVAHIGHITITRYYLKKFGGNN